jgi:hypothetical protein
MATLDDFFAPVEDPMVNEIQTLSEKIRQRRTQMLIHSYLYYVMDENVVDDGKWQVWADELVELQKQRKDIGFYDEAFADWSGATGTHLPFEPWVQKRAKELLNAKINMYNNPKPV